MNRRSPTLLLSLLILLSLIAVSTGLSAGAIAISPGQLLEALSGGGDDLHRSVVWELRAPRVAAAFIAGGLLACAGALMQVLLRNPLADPYILGISGGAAVAALLAISAGLSSLWVSGAGFGGAIFSMLLVFGIARSGGHWDSLRLLLTGVVIAAGWGAATSFLLAINADRQIHSMLFWLMGDLSHATGPGWTAGLLLAGAVAAWSVGRPLDLLARGEVQAAALGVNVAALRLLLYFLASVMTAAAVMLAGSVGFVGLIIPHMMRLAGCTRHRILLPACVLAGGSLLALSDTLARTLLAPEQLPVGVITAFIGVPLFLVLLRRDNGRPAP